MPPRPRWKEGGQLQIGPGSTAIRTSDLPLERPVTLPLDQGGRQKKKKKNEGEGGQEEGGGQEEEGGGQEEGQLRRRTRDAVAIT